MTNPRKMMMAASGLSLGPKNELFTWGEGAGGGQGHGNTTDYSSPVQVGSLTDWGTLSNMNPNSGRNDFVSTMNVKTDGTLWGWGVNAEGQLGDGTTTTRSSPVQIGSDTDWSICATGQRKSLATKTDGTLWAWGNNIYGQLGLGSLTDYSSPVQVGSLTDWSIPCCMYYTSAAIKTDGTLWTWGYAANYGQTGQGNQTNISSPVQVGSLTNWAKINPGSAQRGFCAVKTDGTLWVWGGNYYGGLGQGNRTNYSSPVQVGSLTNWAEAAGGSLSCTAVKTDGTLWSWGSGGAGRGGRGNTTNVSSPIQVGSLTDWASLGHGFMHTLCVKTDGTLWAWGYNHAGQLGDGTTTNRSSPVQIGSATYWVSAYAGGGQTNSNSGAIKQS